ncbi:putative nucleotide-binding protein containing TIR-like domain protein [uncultured archaeon]|nr:putative nucleotide-binding protein containing TIR-like domain protein [uncultured archaeon]
MPLIVMEKNVSKLLKIIRDKLEDPYSITDCHNDAIKLACDTFGMKNEHCITLLNAVTYSDAIRKEVIRDEIDSMILELEGDISQKSQKLLNDIKSQINNPSDNAKIESPLKSHKDDSKKDLKRVFIVHGHDNEMKEAVARVIQTLGLKPIILHEKPDENKTIIEKFEKYSDVDFAVILLSPDDFAYENGKSPTEGKHRARQNVILELGFFLAKLGRDGVFIIHRENNNFEFPTDYSGVLYTLFDKSGMWKYKMTDEMKAIDPKIDKNKLQN